MIQKLEEWCILFTSVEFWIGILEAFKDFGPAAPILLACVESFFPFLPLVAIVTFNITAYGSVLGFLYSWTGTSIGCTLVFLFFRKIVKVHLQTWLHANKYFDKALKWVSQVNEKTLFAVAMMPFTPSVFVNLAFGLSDFEIKRFLTVLIAAKSVMMLLLLGFGSSVAASVENPEYLALAAVILIVLWLASKSVSRKNGL